MIHKENIFNLFEQLKYEIESDSHWLTRDSQDSILTKLEYLENYIYEQYNKSKQQSQYN